MPTFPPHTSSLTRFCLYTVHTAFKHTEEHVKYCLPPAALITNEHGLPSNNKHVVLLRIVLYLAITRFKVLIIITEKTFIFIIATLNHTGRHLRNIHPCFIWHRKMLFFAVNL